MVSYWLAFSWGLVILASMVGWGAVVNRLLFPRYPVDWGQRAAWGLALSVIVGGVLNVLHWISRETVLAYLGLGLLSWLLNAAISRSFQFKWLTSSTAGDENRRIVTIGILIVALLALIQYAASVSGVQHGGSVSPTNFNRDDDFQAYFVFPEKMLQTGSMGPDPFSGRRLQSSLGGQSFLDTFVLCILSVQNLHVLDSGLGLLIILGLLWGTMQEHGISPAGSVGALLVFLLIPAPTSNITSLYTGLALFLSLYRTLDWKEFPSSPFVSRLLIIAMLSAAICSLKSNFIPACVFALSCSFLCHLFGKSNRRIAAAEAVSTGLLVFAFMLPWMISMYQSSGTLLYPLLGKGYHQSVYGSSLSAYSELTLVKSCRLILEHMTDASSLVLLGLGAFYAWSREWGICGREGALSVALGAVAGKFVMVLATGGVYSYQYSFAFVTAATGVLIAEGLRSCKVRNQNEPSHSTGWIVAVAAGVFLVGSWWDGSRRMYLDCLSSIREGVENAPLVSSQEVKEYKGLQESIPPLEVVLTRLDKPFLLDFQRNKIFIADLPGQVSPPPGMPLFRGSEPLASYLIAKSIRYVAYSYGDEAGFTRYFSYMLSPYNNVWGRTIAQHTYDTQDNLTELGKTRKRIYDDGKSFVLDLQQRNR
jgi:hypothetical protein